MQIYVVGFYYKCPEKKITEYLGSNEVMVFPTDKMCLEAKAFRQATPHQQMANKTKVRRIK